MRTSGAIAVLVAQFAFASVSGAATAGEAIEWCKGYPDTPQKGLCEGYIKAVAQGLRSTDPDINAGYRSCVPPEEPVENLVKLFLDYTARRPQVRSQALVVAVGAALQGKYPCR
jgi:hypothetical protein